MSAYLSTATRVETSDGFELAVRRPHLSFEGWIVELELTDNSPLE